MSSSSTNKQPNTAASGASSGRKKAASTVAQPKNNKASGAGDVDPELDDVRYTFEVLAKVGWAPKTKLAFGVFVFINFVSAIFTNIGDCDETFNYWEPTHYLLYGDGYQTWEYAPQYGLRSYSYVLLHAIPGFLASLVFHDKIIVFYTIRVAIGLFSAFTEAFFFDAVKKRFGPGIAFHTFIFLLVAPGMFAAVTSYLPSSFAMAGLMLAFGFWMKENYLAAVLASAFATIFSCWPFVILITIPIAVDSVRVRGIFKVIGYALLSLLIFLLPTIVVDAFFYRKLIIPMLNILIYNVMGPTGGSTLYGVEPWYFYMINGFLNFNYVFFIALFSVPIFFISPYFNANVHVDTGIHNRKSVWIYLTPMYIWLTFMISLPHKEERFLYPIYPLICLGGALGLTYLLRGIGRVFFRIVLQRRNFAKGISSIAAIVVLLFIVLSLSRIAALMYNYSAPTMVWKHMSQYELKSGSIQHYPIPGQVNLCVGKEWYRFPSHFFVPGKRFRMNFLKSEFGGELPRLYEPWDQGGTWIELLSEFNDRNEEVYRYIDASECHYIVDLDLPDQVEPHYAKLTPWQKQYNHRFLDAPKSHPLARAFFIPYFSLALNQYENYWLLKNNDLIHEHSPDGRYVRVYPADYNDAEHLENPGRRAKIAKEEHERKKLEKKLEAERRKEEEEDI